MAKAGFAVLLIVMIASVVDARELRRLLVSADLVWIGVAFLALTAQTIFSALRWQLTAGRLDHVFGWRFAVREYYLSQVINQTLPGGMLGDAGRAMRCRGAAGLGKATMAVALDRLAGQMALVGVLVAGLGVTLLAPGGFAPPVWIATTVAVICGGLLAAMIVVRVAGWLPGIAGRGADALLRGARAGLFNRSVLVRQVVLSVATAATTLIAFDASARAVGAVLPVGAVLVLVPLVLFAMLVPLTISGWGLREGTAAALLPLAGLTSAKAVAASVIFGLTFLAAVLPGLWPLLTPSLSPPIHTRTRWGPAENSPPRDD